MQDEYYAWITSCGYTLERGTKGSTAEHLSVEEYKLQKTAEQLAELQGQVEEVKGVNEIGAKNLPFNMVSVKRDDFNTLVAAAKGYVTAKAAEAENAENERLFKENEQLRVANADVYAKYHQLDHAFGEFYDIIFLRGTPRFRASPKIIDFAKRLCSILIINDKCVIDISY